MHMHVIGGQDLVLGFKLAGVRGDVVRTPEEIVAAIESAGADPNVAVILVSKAVAMHAKAQIAHLRVRQGYPIVLEIAEPGESAKDPEALMRFVGDSIGLTL